MIKKTIETDKKPKINLERAYSILKKPVVTEKSTLVSQDRQYVFKVAPDATKPELKAAVEFIFKVKVDSVNTLVRKGKTRKFKGRLGKMSDAKFAYICLKEGHTIDIGAGL